MNHILLNWILSGLALVLAAACGIYCWLKIRTRLNNQLAKITELTDLTASLRKDCDDARRMVSRLNRELSSSTAFGRIADIEHLAINASCIAGNAHAALDKTGSMNLSPLIHGHASLMQLLQIDFSRGRIPDSPSGYHVLEIGTTRERTWPQSSTSRLAAICRYLDLRMLTVDIDPDNITAALNSVHPYPGIVEGVASAGEDFLDEWVGELPPYIYLDAYDYDHGEHSEDRQARYEELQGGRISDEQCWKMHLDCAMAFASKCPQGGIVVFDDAFLQDGNWAGKGTTAIPYMLENGFEIIGQQSHTCILRRGQ